MMSHWRGHVVKTLVDGVGGEFEIGLAIQGLQVRPALGGVVVLVDSLVVGEELAVTGE